MNTTDPFMIHQRYHLQILHLKDTLHEYVKGVAIQAYLPSRAAIMYDNHNQQQQSDVQLNDVENRVRMKTDHTSTSTSSNNKTIFQSL